MLRLAITADGWMQALAIGAAVPTIAEYACQCVSHRMKG